MHPHAANLQQAGFQNSPRQHVADGIAYGGNTAADLLRDKPVGLATAGHPADFIAFWITRKIGALTGDRNVIVPAAVQRWLAYNNTSGAYSLTVKTAAGTGVALGQGGGGSIYSDGTNVVAADLSAGGVVAGPLTMAGAAFNAAVGANIASAATINLTTATGNFTHITGTTTISAVTLGAGMCRTVIFDGSLLLDFHPTNNNLPGALAITTAAGDRAVYWSDGTTVYCVSYTRASGLPLVGGVNPGSFVFHAGTSAPAGTLLCPTSAANISRSTYAALFAAIGTTWGAGDGSTTFGLPWFAADYTVLQAAANVGTSTAGEVIAHTHPLRIYADEGGASGVTDNGSSTNTNTVSTQSTGGGSNVAAGVRILICIKY